MPGANRIPGYHDLTIIWPFLPAGQYQSRTASASISTSNPAGSPT